MSNRDRAIILLAHNTAKACRNHVAMNPNHFGSTADLDRDTVVSFFHQISQPGVLADSITAQVDHADQMGGRAWVRFQNAVLRQTATDLGWRDDLWI